MSNILLLTAMEVIICKFEIYVPTHPSLSKARNLIRYADIYSYAKI